MRRSLQAFACALPVCLSPALVGCQGPLSEASGGTPAADDVQAVVVPPDGVAGYFLDTFGLSLADVRWGDLHTHTMYSQDAALQAIMGTDPSTPATAYAAARARGLTFVMTSDHAEAPVPGNIPADDPSADVWASTLAMSLAADDAVDDADGTFVPYVGYEYTNPFPCTDTTGAGDGITECPARGIGIPLAERACLSLGGLESCEAHGHKNVVFRDLVGAPDRRLSFLDPASWTTPPADCAVDPDAYCGFDSYTDHAFRNDDVWAWLRAEGFAADADGPKALTVIHTPGNIHHVDWDFVDADFVRNVEIYSQWGNSEGPPPASCADQDDIDVDLPQGNLNDESSLIRPQLQQRWLEDGDPRYALSFVAGSDDHSGLPGGEGDGNGGLVGAVTTAVDRVGIFDALAARRTVAAIYHAAQGPLPLLFAVETGGADYFGGDLGDVGPDGATLRILADPQVTEVQVVVDGCTVRTLAGPAHVLHLTRQELPAGDRHYVYVRARAPAPGRNPAVDWNQTWSSPVYLRPAL